MTDYKPTTAEERERWQNGLAQVPGNGLFAAKGCLERLIADVERETWTRNGPDVEKPEGECFVWCSVWADIGHWSRKCKKWFCDDDTYPDTDVTHFKHINPPEQTP